MLYLIIPIIFLIFYVNKINKKRDKLYEINLKRVEKSLDYIDSKSYQNDILVDHQVFKSMKELRSSEEYEEREVISRQALLYKTGKGRKLLRKQQKSLMDLFCYDRKYFFDFTMRKYRKIEIIEQLEFTDDPVLINRMLNYLAK